MCRLNACVISDSIVDYRVRTRCAKGANPLVHPSFECAEVRLVCYRSLELTLRHGCLALAEKQGAHTLGIRFFFRGVLHRDNIAKDAGYCPFVCEHPGIEGADSHTEHSTQGRIGIPNDIFAPPR